MNVDQDKKTENLNKRLIYLKHEMAKFFDCDDAYIKFSDPHYIDESAKIEVELMLINRDAASLKKFNSSTYYFDFEVEYIKKEEIRYEENFYDYENINEFFNKIYTDIKKLEKKSV
jgi:hypothetical protein